MITTLALALPLMGGPAYAIGGGADAEIRMRQPGDVGPEGEEADRSYDLDAAMRARLTASFQRSVLALEYQPRISFRDFTNTPGGDVLQVAGLGGRWRWKRASLAFAQTAAYGARNFSPFGRPVAFEGAPQQQEAPAEGEQPSEPEPQVQTDRSAGQAALEGAVEFFGLETSAGLRLLLTRRSRLDVAGEYFYGGGLDEEAREVLPLRSGVRGTTGWGYGVTSTDSLITQVDVRHATTERTGDRPVDSTAGNVAERWRKRWGTNTESELGVGVAVASSTTTDDLQTGMAGTARLSHVFPGVGPERSALALDVGAGTDYVLDQITGEAEQRLQASARLAWTVEEWVLTGAVSRTQSLLADPEDSLELNQALVSLAVTVEDYFGATVGFRVVDQRLGEEVAADPLRLDGLAWAVFAGIGFVLEDQPLH